MKKTDRVSFFRTPFFTLVSNLLLAYVAFMLCRIIFVWYNWDAFAGSLNDRNLVISLIRGSLRFDTAGILYLLLPYIALMLLPLHFKETRGFHIFMKCLFIVAVCAGIVANSCDAVYFPSTGCRS